MSDQPDSATGRGSREICTTVEVARRLGLAVRSVQLMVDRGDLEAWKTPGGHRRISRASVDRWEASHHGGAQVSGENLPLLPSRRGGRRTAGADRPRVLLIEDSRHFRNLISLLVRQRFPSVQMYEADDGITGLTSVGALQPDVLLVDILLPGIDGVTLVTGLRSHAQFARIKLIVVTALEHADLQPYEFALQGIAVVHKSRLAHDLPPLLAAALEIAPQARENAAA